jgi:hypothetical protein
MEEKAQTTSQSAKELRGKQHLVLTTRDDDVQRAVHLKIKEKLRIDARNRFSSSRKIKKDFSRHRSRHVSFLDEIVTCQSDCLYQFDKGGRERRLYSTAVFSVFVKREESPTDRNTYGRK